MVKGTSVLRELNKRKILSLIRQQGKSSRQDLVDQMNVSKNTISLIVDELIRHNVLEESGEKEEGRRGRPKVIIQINKGTLKTIGISISKNHIDYSVINYYGEIIESKSLGNNSTDVKETIKEILKIAHILLARYEHVIGIGIGVPGNVDSEKKYIYESTHLGWENVSLDELNQLRSFVLVRNSVNMGATQALDWDSQAGKQSNLFYLRVSEGVGGAYVVNNKLIEGSSWTAGEIGHISVDAGGRICECGQKGCLEQLVNYNALINDLASIGIAPPSIIANSLLFEQKHFESNNVKNLMLDYGKNFGKALIYVMHLLNPSKVILDTPYNVFDDFQNACLSFIKKNALKMPNKNTKFIFEKERYDLSKGAAFSIIINYEQEMESYSF